VSEARRVGAALTELMARIVDASGERATLPTLASFAAHVSAERTRLNGAPDPAALDEAARRYDAAGRSFEAAYCRFRAARRYSRWAALALQHPIQPL
jgi:hypothetical protein